MWPEWRCDSGGRRRGRRAPGVAQLPPSGRRGNHAPGGRFRNRLRVGRRAFRNDDFGGGGFLEPVFILDAEDQVRSVGKWILSSGRKDGLDLNRFRKFLAAGIAGDAVDERLFIAIRSRELDGSGSGFRIDDAIRLGRIDPLGVASFDGHGQASGLAVIQRMSYASHKHRKVLVIPVDQVENERVIRPEFHRSRLSFRRSDQRNDLQSCHQKFNPVSKRIFQESGANRKTMQLRMLPEAADASLPPSLTSMVARWKTPDTFMDSARGLPLIRVKSARGPNSSVIPI